MPEPREDLSGQAVRDGRFRLHRRLGAGAYGAVDQATLATGGTVRIVSAGRDSGVIRLLKGSSEVVASTRWYGDISLEVGQNGELSWVTSRQRNSRRAA